MNECAAFTHGSQWQFKKMMSVLLFYFRTCWLLPRREADGLLQEAELRVVQPEGLVHHVGRRLHVYLQDGHRFAVLGFKPDLRGRRGSKV